MRFQPEAASLHAQRRIACYYPSRPARTEAAPTDPSHGPLAAPGSDFHLDGADVDGTLMDFLVPSCHTKPVNHLWTIPAEIPDQSTQVADAPSLGLAVDGRDILGDGNVDAELFFDFADSTPTGKDIAVRPPLGFSAAPRRLDLAGLHAALETNFSYAMDKIREAPSTMLLENQTPWCHPLLYRENMPRVMQEAVSACALHASKNAVNSRVIMRCIETKVDDLLSSAPQPGLLNALARTQALLLYQTIRFFDGDVLARSSPDTWLTTPPCHVDNPSLSLSQPSREFWRAWADQESARRTFLVASFFVHIWKMLTGQPLVQRWDDEELKRQCWTLSAHLWGAGDVLDFAAAWRDKRHRVVRRGTIRSTMMDAEAGDVEAFGKMLMTAALGVDETENWLASMGEKL
ncbi:hypothetical protein LA080_008915 [Diaporthe eres]|nr:hypothetical protein LA080_008915 [Diaporthe eres]